jgi:hypothetical protein
MTYIPKSKLKIQSTSGDEFIYKLTKKPYIGTYIETSNYKFYAGGSTTDLSTEIIPSEEISSVEFGYHSDVRKYQILNKTPFNILKKTTPVINTRNTPSEKDHNLGYFLRFFAKKHNLDNDYIEIDPETYVKLKSKLPHHDHRLYKVGQIEWSLKGDVEKTNRLQLKKLEIQFPLLYTLFPLLNEYQSSVDKRLINTQSKLDLRILLFLINCPTIAAP